MRLLAKIFLGLPAVLLGAGAGGYVWLRNSPYWAGITLYAEDRPVENFQSMEQIFHAVDVPAGGNVWAFATDTSGLPETYAFDGSNQSVATFLDETVAFFRAIAAHTHSNVP